MLSTERTHPLYLPMPGIGENEFDLLHEARPCRLNEPFELGLGFRLETFRVTHSGFRVQGSGFRVQGLEFAGDSVCSYP